MASDRRSVAIVHPRMGCGGSEAMVMWGIEALKRDFGVTVITSNTVDLVFLNSFYGTQIRRHEVTMRQVWIPRFLLRTRSGAALRGAFFQRAVRGIVFPQDVLISAYNLCDFGVPAIHLVDLSWDEDLRTRYSIMPAGVEGLFHRFSLVRAAYLGLARRISRPSGRDLLAGDDVVLAYSDWIASAIEQKHKPPSRNEATILFASVEFQKRSASNASLQLSVGFGRWGMKSDSA
jgi:hypothetical protein